MPTPERLSSQNNDLIKALADETIAQTKLLAKLEEQAKTLIENVKECKDKIEGIEKKIFIGNGTPSILARIGRSEEKLIEIENAANRVLDTKRFWLNITIPLLITSSISSIAIFIQMADLLWKK